jgi:dTDP-4-dehydrorhamnose reductase
MKLCPEATVIRVSWLYSNQGQNFFLTMMKLAFSGKDLEIVDDQVSSPTYAGILVEDILSLLTSGRELPAGIIHYSLKGETSWKEFADAIFARTDHNCDVKSVTSEEYGAEADRPSYSKLDHSTWDTSIGKIELSWEDGLARCMKEYLHQKEPDA